MYTRPVLAQGAGLPSFKAEASLVSGEAWITMRADGSLPLRCHVVSNGLSSSKLLFYGTVLEFQIPAFRQGELVWDTLACLCWLIESLATLLTASNPGFHLLVLVVVVVFLTSYLPFQVECFYNFAEIPCKEVQKHVVLYRFMDPFYLFALLVNTLGVRDAPVRGKVTHLHYVKKVALWNSLVIV